MQVIDTYQTINQAPTATVTTENLESKMRFDTSDVRTSSEDRNNDALHKGQSTTDAPLLIHAPLIRSPRSSITASMLSSTPADLNQDFQHILSQMAREDDGDNSWQAMDVDEDDEASNSLRRVSFAGQHFYLAPEGCEWTE